MGGADRLHCVGLIILPNRNIIIIVIVMMVVDDDDNINLTFYVPFSMQTVFRESG